MTSLVLGLSILVQAAAAVLALRLNWLYGRQWAWKLISLAIVLMTIRRCFTFVRLVSGENTDILWLDESETLMTSAMLSLVVSLFLLVGVALVSPIFRRLKQVESVLAGEADRLQRVVTINEVEFQLARQVQQQLYPDADPNIEGLDISGRAIPARSASGDYFDYLTLADGRVGIVIGDASGHGMGAAFLATETRSHLHAAWRSCDNPADILSVTNSFLCSDTRNGQFMTLLIVQVDLARRTIVTASAGHPTFLVHESGEVETWEAEGMPLGIDCQMPYGSSPPYQLVAGDIVLLCTDGLWEAHAPDDSQFGMQRVFDLVHKHRGRSSREIVELLFRAVERHTGRAIPDDDTTIVVMKVEASPDKSR